jgi:hypothetical protein
MSAIAFTLRGLHVLDLDDVLPAELRAAHVEGDRDRRVPVEALHADDPEDLEREAVADVVDHRPVLDGLDLELAHGPAP